MIKKFLLAAALAVLPFSAYAFEAKLQNAINAVPQINDNCSASVIYSDRNEETGKVKTVILTAKHCVDSQLMNQKNTVDFPVYQNNRVVQKNSYTATVLGKFYKADLALLQLDDTQTLFKNVIKIANKDTTLTLGEDTVVVGYPFGLGINVTFGNFMTFITIDQWKPGTEFIRATPDIGPGNSGGALLRKTPDGYELIGVTTAVIPGWPFTGLFTPYTDVNEYLKTALPEVLQESSEPSVVSPVGK